MVGIPVGEGVTSFPYGNSYKGAYKEEIRYFTGLTGTLYDKDGNIFEKWVNGKEIPEEAVEKEKEIGILFRDTPFSKWREEGETF